MDAYPAHLQAVEDLIPAFLLSHTIKGDVVNKDVDAMASEVATAVWNPK